MWNKETRCCCYVLAPVPHRESTVSSINIIQVLFFMLLQLLLNVTDGSDRRFLMKRYSHMNEMQLIDMFYNKFNTPFQICETCRCFSYIFVQYFWTDHYWKCSNEMKRLWHRDEIISVSLPPLVILTVSCVKWNARNLMR